MKRKTAIIFFLIFLLLCILGIILIFKYLDFVDKKNSYDINETFTVANWNLQIFGDKKANNTELMNTVGETISKYDVIFIQEIRDANSDSFFKLCGMLPEYSCNISSRAGRSSSKEQYGVIYLKKYSLISLKDFNPDQSDRWERPPVLAVFIVGNYSFSIYNIHTKPDDVERELDYLEDLVIDEGNVVILGDLNADCSYYPKRKSFMEWNWIIKDDEDTTSGNSNCAYDRIILNDDAYGEKVDYGIYKKTDESISDHYLVWIRIRNYEYDRDVNFKNWIKI